MDEEPYGRILNKLIKELGDWGDKHRKRIMTARTAKTFLSLF